MNKTTKGSLAAGAAAVLLLGGAGSLAFWTDNAIVDGGQVNAGFLYLDSASDVTPDAEDCAPFTYAEGFAGDTTGPVLNFVPGDVITTTCVFTIRAEGDNLAAKPSIAEAVTIDTAEDTSFEATVTSELELNGNPYDAVTNPITDEQSGDELVATITVDIPFGLDDVTQNGNDTKNVDAILSELDVVLTQLDPNP